MKIYILGSKGMLGAYLVRYLNGIGISKEILDVLDQSNSLYQKLENLGIKQDDVIINAIGLTNKRKDYDRYFYLVNGFFPIMLAEYCNEKRIKLIHVSTDCVFKGDCGYYNENSKLDAVDIYGVSKMLGDVAECTIIRTSIIGESTRNKNDLLEWVRCNKDKTIKGYTNHLWNGVTCLQFARICEQIIRNDLYWKGVRHIFTEDIVTKADLLLMINEIYGLGKIIKPVFQGDRYVNRTLYTIYKDIQFNMPSLVDQIVEQKEFKL